MTIYDMVQSVLADKTQWYAGEVVLLHQGNDSCAILKEHEGAFINLMVYANGQWGPIIQVAILDLMRGWQPLKSFTQEKYKDWAESTKKMLRIA